MCAVRAPKRTTTAIAMQPQKTMDAMTKKDRGVLGVSMLVGMNPPATKAATQQIAAITMSPKMAPYMRP